MSGQIAEQFAGQALAPVSRSWTTRRDEKQRRMQLIEPWMEGPIIPRERIIDVLETVVVSKTDTR
jgi:malonate decarboxylase alpha subunit